MTPLTPPLYNNKHHQYIRERQTRVNNLLDQYLSTLPHTQFILNEAMRYAVLNHDGKRLRPLLVYATGELFNLDLDQLDEPACAVELIHTYSLIHDDLPALDNSDERRNQPSCHKVFGEAIALLVGDALQAFSFELLTKAKVSDEKKIKMLSVLAKAAQSMVNGQSAEFIKENSVPDAIMLEKNYQFKTGALINASVQLGAFASDVSDKQLKQLSNFANCLGLAYQIQDDINDHDPTIFNYVNAVGLAKAHSRFQSLYDEALKQLNGFSDTVCVLINLVDQILSLHTSRS